MNLRRISLTSLVVVAALSSGCVLDGTEPMPEETDEPVASVEQHIDPGTAIGAAYLLSETMKNITDSTATIVGLFKQSSGPGYDPRIGQILAELTQIRADLAELHRQIALVIDMLERMNYRMDFAEKQGLMLWLESIKATSDAAIGSLNTWVNNGRQSDSDRSAALFNSELALQNFSLGANSVKYWFTTHEGELQWDYRIALTYHLYAAATRATVLATVYANNFRLYDSDANTLRIQADALDSVWTKGQGTITVSTTPMVSGNKYTVGWWGSVVDHLSNTQPDTGPICIGDERERLCAMHDIYNKSTWWNFTTQTAADQMNQKLNPWFRTQAEKFYGFYYAHAQAEKLRALANARRTLIISH